MYPSFNDGGNFWVALRKFGFLPNPYRSGNTYFTHGDQGGHNLMLSVSAGNCKIFVFALPMTINLAMATTMRSYEKWYSGSVTMTCEMVMLLSTCSSIPGEDIFWYKTERAFMANDACTNYK